MTAAPPPIAGRYEVLRSLGRGAFAETLLARDSQGGRLVAVKVLHARAAQTWKSYELFEREARVLGGLRHHAVPAVVEVLRAPWQGAEAALLIMEYVEGASLRQVIEERRHLTPGEVLALFVEALGVLDYLHTRVPPVLHRDIKPANVIVRPDGTPALVDFGSVRNVFKAPDEDGSTVAGTYGYMPYEQTMGQASPASDLYALGATFLHLLTGRAPPDFMNAEGRIAVPDALPCGEPLRSVLARMLAPAPGDRFQSAREARATLLEPRPGTALARAGAAPAATAVAPLGPAPRALTGETRAVWKAASYGLAQYADPSEKVESFGVTDVLLMALFSLLTAGVLPAVIWSQYAARKRRLKRFFAAGVAATGRVIAMDETDIGFARKMTRVRYEFEADGRRLVDHDQVPPSIAGRWDQGTPLRLLYLPGEHYDSVIIGAA